MTDGDAGPATGSWTTHHTAEMWAALTSMGVQPPEIGVRTWAVDRLGHS